jgi:hypothetical protein
MSGCEKFPLHFPTGRDGGRLQAGQAMPRFRYSPTGVAVPGVSDPGDPRRGGRRDRPRTEHVCRRRPASDALSAIDEQYLTAARREAVERIAAYARAAGANAVPGMRFAQRPSHRIEWRPAPRAPPWSCRHSAPGCPSCPDAAARQDRRDPDRAGGYRLGATALTFCERAWLAVPGAGVTAAPGRGALVRGSIGHQWRYRTVQRPFRTVGPPAAATCGVGRVSLTHGGPDRAGCGHERMLRAGLLQRFDDRSPVE